MKTLCTITALLVALVSPIPPVFATIVLVWFSFKTGVTQLAVKSIGYLLVGLLMAIITVEIWLSIATFVFIVAGFLVSVAGVIS